MDKKKFEELRKPLKSTFLPVPQSQKLATQCEEADKRFDQAVLEKYKEFKRGVKN
ncbi:MAG: hypothetical protein PHD51_01285 [Patescibacteria group bacterium]|nr:hypothetical protein [Patescibacteria group bacterium]MDD5490506.1 hypothetical protein [Patescibacteria group bacterium]